MNILISLVILILVTVGFLATQTARDKDSSELNNEVASEQTNVNAIHRSAQGLTHFPSDVLKHMSIKSLDLSQNKLTGALPAEIRFLQNLETLDISDNRMTGLPAEIGQLPKLRVLDASNNELTGIPHELGNLQTLEILDLSGNNISSHDLEIIRAKLPQTTQIVL